MLTTGIRTPVGLKIHGWRRSTDQEIGRQVEAILSGVPGTRSVFSERTARLLPRCDLDRKATCQQRPFHRRRAEALSTAIGGENVSTTIEGRERYPINVRYKRDFRSDVDALGRVLVTAGGAMQIPLAELANDRMRNGPAMIRDENGLLTGYVYVDLAGRDARRLRERKDGRNCRRSSITRRLHACLERTIRSRWNA